MGQTDPRTVVQILVLNLPVIAAACILVFYFLTDRGMLPAFRTESMYSLFVVILLPLSGSLLIIQFIMWVSARRRR